MWAMYPASHLAGCTACSYMQPGDAMPSDLRGLGSYRRPGDEYPAGYLCGLGAPPAVLVGRTVVGLPHLTSGAILLSGTLSALSLALFASDRAESGYALGILAALSGAVLGAIRVFGEE